MITITRVSTHVTLVGCGASAGHIIIIIIIISIIIIIIIIIVITIIKAFGSGRPRIPGNPIPCASHLGYAATNAQLCIEQS